jgi:PTS system nitrogen regulatory IIA component
MTITELLSPPLVIADLKATTKADVLAELTDALVAHDPTLHREQIIQVLVEREKLGSTGIGDGVAIPHGKLKGLPSLMLSFGRSREGVNFDSMDGKPAHLFFLLVAPEESVGIHLKALARISKLLKDSVVRRKLVDAGDAEAICQLISDEESRL